MTHHMLKKLSELASKLDRQGLFDQADKIDSIITNLSKQAGEFSTYQEAEQGHPVKTTGAVVVWIDLTDISSSFRGPEFIVDVTGYRMGDQEQKISDYASEAIPTKRFQGAAPKVDIDITNYLLQLQKDIRYNIQNYKHHYPVAKKAGALEWGSKAIPKQPATKPITPTRSTPDMVATKVPV